MLGDYRRQQTERGAGVDSQRPAAAGEVTAKWLARLDAASEAALKRRHKR